MAGALENPLGVTFLVAFFLSINSCVLLEDDGNWRPTGTGTEGLNASATRKADAIKQAMTLILDMILMILILILILLFEIFIQSQEEVK
jgi:hypothetical protein